MPKEGGRGWRPPGPDFPSRSVQRPPPTKASQSTPNTTGEGSAVSATTEGGGGV